MNQLLASIGLALLLCSSVSYSAAGTTGLSCGSAPGKVDAVLIEEMLVQ